MRKRKEGGYRLHCRCDNFFCRRSYRAWREGVGLFKTNLEEFNKRHKKKYKLSASIGVGVFDLEKGNVDKIMEKIDKLMYEDKRAYYALTHNDRRRGR